MGMGQFKKRGNAKSPITAVITAVITAREYYREAPCLFQQFDLSFRFKSNYLLPGCRIMSSKLYFTSISRRGVCRNVVPAFSHQYDCLGRVGVKFSSSITLKGD